MTSSAVIAVVGCAAGGLEQLRTELVAPLCALGHTVAVTLTPTAGRWLTEQGETRHIETLTGLPVRDRPRLPAETSPHPAPTVIVVAPATANSVTKIALGVADNQALTVVNENLCLVPTVIFPRVNAAHARHPAWPAHLDALRAAGARLVYGPDVWPLHEPRTAPGRPLPWAAIRDAVTTLVTGANTEG